MQILRFVLSSGTMEVLGMQMEKAAAWSLAMRST
jgi:hypothetical protein